MSCLVRLMLHGSLTTQVEVVQVACKLQEIIAVIGLRVACNIEQ